MSTLQIETPRDFVPLLAPRRYKGAYGGRGSGKSHFFAELIVEECYRRPVRAVCIREVQNTIKDSVKQLLSDKIQKLGLGSFFEVLDTEVRGANGSLIIFRGMQHYSAESIKSLEGYDIAWVEEAQSLSQRSLDMLRPTIRKEGSEIWFSWNPDSEDDPVDVFFRQQGRDDAICVKVNYDSNPWFPSVLRVDMEADYVADPEKAAHVWGGEYSVVTEGAYYARLLAQAEKEGRIGAFPYDPALPVYTAWDIGVDDYTAVWYFQENRQQVRAIDYYETSGDGAEMIIAEAIKPKPYEYAAHYMPHDVKVREWGAGAKSRYQTLMGLGMNNIRVGVAQGPAERINASRAIMPIVSFNKETTHQGIKRLRNYRRRLNAATGTYSGPLHDENSHGADAFGEFAVNCQVRPKPQQQKPKAPENRYRKPASGGENWKTM